MNIKSSEASLKFVKIFTGELSVKLICAGGQAAILLMYIVTSGMLEYGTNCFSFGKMKKKEIMDVFGVKMGAIYKSLRILKKIGLVKTDGLGNYIVNKKYFEYGKSTSDWKNKISLNAFENDHTNRDTGQVFSSKLQ